MMWEAAAEWHGLLLSGPVVFPVDIMNRFDCLAAAVQAHVECSCHGTMRFDDGELSMTNWHSSPVRQT